MNARPVAAVIPALDTSDGAGVRIRRSLGQRPDARLDPFLMLDEFGSDEAADYVAGFPAHPHRGFETVTYMLEGHMLHEDHLGNRGHLGPGGVQWMTAGRGIIHSEMPQQESGRMRGFQLWLNLPAKDKLCDPSYRDIPPEAIPRVGFEGGSVRVVAGRFEQADAVTDGAVAGGAVRPLYLDVHLEPGARFSHPVSGERNALIYVYEGVLDVSPVAVERGHAAILGAGEAVDVRTGSAGARALLLAAAPIGEPVVQYGPFVMNTRAEIEQALADYQAGTLATPARALD